MYRVTKTFGHDRGLSCCFRQWRAAHSHCRFLHGYALSIKLTFGAFTLDGRNWVIDFGDFGEVKKMLHDTFDHKLVVAADDPQLDTLSMLAGLGCADVLVLPVVGCEAFAEYVHKRVQAWLDLNCDGSHRVFLLDVTVAEHDGNSASYTDSGLLGEPFLSELLRSNDPTLQFAIDPEAQ